MSKRELRRVGVLGLRRSSGKVVSLSILPQGFPVGFLFAIARLTSARSSRAMA
jgi:hypothetical protein